MTKNMLLSAVTIVSLLTGCDRATEKMADLVQIAPTTIVFPPGYEIAIDGKPAKVFGQSKCPTNEDASMRFMGPSPLDAYNCLVISPTDKTVLVHVFFNDKLTDETWVVEHEKNKVSLRRYSGLLVVSYDVLRKAGGTVSASFNN